MHRRITGREATANSCPTVAGARTDPSAPTVSAVVNVYLALSGRNWADQIDMQAAPTM